MRGRTNLMAGKGPGAGSGKATGRTQQTTMAVSLFALVAPSSPAFARVAAPGGPQARRPRRMW
jgi:hypothetical protein